MTMTPRFIHQLDQYRAWRRETIRSYGWVIEAVLGDDENPPFAYTAGLSGFGHPELILFATSQPTAATVLNGLGELVRSGQALPTGATVGLPCGSVHLLEFPEPDDWLLTAQALYRLPGGPPVPALLVVPEDDLVPTPGADHPCRFCE